MNKKILIVVFGATFLIGMLSVIISARKNSSTSTASGQPQASSQPATKEPLVDTSDWESYHSEPFGYSVKHPKGWTVDDSEFAKKQEIRITEAINASVKINAYFDKNMDSINKVKQGMKLFEEKMRKDANLTVEQVYTSTEENVGTLVGVGKQRISNISYVFVNRAILASNGRVLIFHGVAKESLPKEYLESLRGIIESFALDKNK